MEIRKLSINHYEDMAKLWSKAGLPYRPKGRDSKEAITAEMQANPDFFLGAFEEGKLLGTVILSCDRRKGWINRLAVDPEHRHHGIAKALIKESEKILRKRGFKIFCAFIEDNNVISKELFKKCGYVEHRDIVYFAKRDSEEV